ncbi:plasmid partitioning protein RepB [Ancylobacter oerskovii]|uniref:Plasmid partitioning protein RepB n=1 Tax=Ancylobacter oerskovii TaxID=459519 RepID=A0ABW4Z528_9HYPH
MDRAVLDYAAKGASRSLLNSIDEMAAKADKLAEGETVVEMEPDLIDASFIRDRRTDDENEFNELLSAIRDNGQSSPILVRPHPKAMGRYMVVFGHRRLRVAQALDRKVRAIVKEMHDRDHVVALGQENSARANVPFIERALFAAELARLHYDDDNATIMSALSVDRTTLSKMLSVANLPAKVLDAVGQAKGIGRDRWYELKLLLDNPANHARADEILREVAMLDMSVDHRFELLVRRLKTAPVRKRPQSDTEKKSWASSDSSLTADMAVQGKRFTLALKAKSSDARAFGEYLSENLDRLYEAFRQDLGSQEDGG